jgi:hypothetical protein
MLAQYSQPSCLCNIDTRKGPVMAYLKKANNATTDGPGMVQDLGSWVQPPK